MVSFDGASTSAKASDVSKDIYIHIYIKKNYLYSLGFIGTYYFYNKMYLNVIEIYKTYNRTIWRIEYLYI
ncbi:hypothetical protein GCM10010275_72480 [Streptomyces litmocidini]|nr:hypothetical protein GCM10010233_65430 [Streptomyces gancidicus]GGV20647.1 hypothetical protein GCM10010275_72480 [Streptomyces litmocidini]GGX38846.1 hypothetical protein GCM10010297_68790 [Streptomyces malachitofuscus]